MSMKKFGKYLLPLAIWCCVTVYVVWALRLAHNRVSTATVDRIEVEIVDSSADRRLVTGRMVREWISRSGIEVAGRPVDEIDLQGIERAVSANGFVGDVSAYTSLQGVLHIEVSQRTPLFRFLGDGYDRYVTDDGFVFGTPASSAIYVPVVTGSYRPQFPPDYEGSLEEYCQSLENEIRAEIKRLRDRRSEIMSGMSVFYEDISRWKKVKTAHKITDSKVKSEWKDMKAEEKRREIARNEDSLRRRRARIEELNGRMALCRESIKKTREKYEDFIKLLNFVGELEDDGFWQSEIVQIVASRSSSGILELRLIPRSGSFEIEFGEIADVDAKLRKLMQFYRDGLRNMGWGEFSEISVAYRGQVVCRKRGKKR